jgi:hypothetical protein
MQASSKTTDLDMSRHNVHKYHGTSALSFSVDRTRQDTMTSTYMPLVLRFPFAANIFHFHNKHCNRTGLE